MQNLMTPAVIVSPTPTPGPTASTTGGTAAAVTPTVVATPSLAYTGADSLPSAYIAGLAILLGAGVIVLRRRLAPKGAGNEEGPRRS
jgi:LPXTG-motif cell wall-anchored protein